MAQANGNSHTQLQAEPRADMAPPQETGALIAYIRSRYHDRHREQMAELVELAAKVERVHEADPRAPRGLSRLLWRMQGDMMAHMHKEESILFPAMQSGAGGLAAPISVMRADHEGHDAEVVRIRDITRDLTLPEGACRTWRRLHEGLALFLNDLAEHMRLEDEVLFPRFEAGA